MASASRSARRRPSYADRRGSAGRRATGCRAGSTTSRTEPYDAITCIEATEHFASDRLSADEKVEVYRAFFERAASWLRPGGRLGLQLICLDNVGHAGSRPAAGPFTDLILDDIFPESMSASLSELVLGWETHFRLEEFLDHTDHYRRTFRAWALAYREHEARGTRAGRRRTVARTFERYFAGGEACFRLREQALYRVDARPGGPSRRSGPSRSAPATSTTRRNRASGRARRTAVSSHYDVSNDFYRLWLGPTMMYSSGLWADGDELADLDAAQLAQDRLLRRAGRARPTGPPRVLDVGCGWGGTLRRLAARHGVGSTASA